MDEKLEMLSLAVAELGNIERSKKGETGRRGHNLSQWVAGQLRVRGGSSGRQERQRIGTGLLTGSITIIMGTGSRIITIAIINITITAMEVVFSGSGR